MYSNSHQLYVHCWYLHESQALMCTINTTSWRWLECSIFWLLDIWNLLLPWQPDAYLPSSLCWPYAQNILGTFLKLKHQTIIHFHFKTKTWKILNVEFFLNSKSSAFLLSPKELCYMHQTVPLCSSKATESIKWQGSDWSVVKPEDYQHQKIFQGTNIF